MNRVNRLDQIRKEGTLGFSQVTQGVMGIASEPKAISKCTSLQVKHQVYVMG